MIIHLAEVHFSKMIESNQKIFHLSVQQSDSNIFSRLVSNIVFPSLPILKRAAGPPITEVCPCPHYGGMPYYPCPLSDRGSGCAGCWRCTGQVLAKVCTHNTWHGPPGTQPLQQQPALPRPCSHRSLRWSRSRRSAPNPFQPVSLKTSIELLWSQSWWQLCPPSRDGDIKISCGYSQLFSCLRLRGEKGSDDVNGVWPGATTQHSTHWQDGKKEIQLKTFRIYYYGKYHNTILQDKTVPKSKPWANNY